MTLRTAGIVCLAAILAAGAFLGVRAELHGSGSDIIFAHNNHTDLDCVDCHTSIDQSTSAQDRHFPSMDVCADCHDIDDDKECGMCHLNADDPQPSPHAPREIVFGHGLHISRGAECRACHGDIATSTTTTPDHMPTMSKCFTCHKLAEGGTDCAVCHADHVSLADIHPIDWRHQHGQKVASNRTWCTQCHQEESFCLDCHRGDNLTGSIHDLNYVYTHGLEARIKRFECAACHDNQTFCNACHERETRLPYLHSSLSWLTDHGMAARRTPEDCASCHDSADPTCARGGCHNDFDGVRGTNPRFHATSMPLFQTHGPWHKDDGYYCFNCHENTRQTMLGFCGYCHGAK